MLRLTASAGIIYCMIISNAFSRCSTSLPAVLISANNAYVAMHAHELQLSSFLKIELQSVTHWTAADAAALQVYFQLLRNKTLEVSSGQCAVNPELDNAAPILSVFSRFGTSASQCETTVLLLASRMESITSDGDFEKAKKTAAVRFGGNWQERQLIANLYPAGSLASATFGLAPTNFDLLPLITDLNKAFPAPTLLACDKDAWNEYFVDITPSALQSIRPVAQAHTPGLKSTNFVFLRNPVMSKPDRIAQLLHYRLCGSRVRTHFEKCRMVRSGLIVWDIMPVPESYAADLGAGRLIDRVVSEIGESARSYLEDNMRVLPLGVE